MRKASQDGGDSSSITSGTENDIRNVAPGILKSTKNSIKRKVQNFSHESDDMANEPLLHKNKEVRPKKELTEVEKQSAKFLLSKSKTDYASEKGNDKDKLLADDKIEKPSITDVTGITEALISNGLKDKTKVTTQSIYSTSIHNHMNTNVFKSPDAPKGTVIAKTQTLVELDTSKPPGYNPSPLIFTTAKIHTDGKTLQMEPVQVTPVPILCTIESGVVKTDTKILDIENSSQQHREMKNIVAPAPMTQVALISKLPEKHDVQPTTKETFSTNASIKPLTCENKGSISDNKVKATQNGSIISCKSTVAQISNISKILPEDMINTKHIQSTANIVNKVGTTPIKMQNSQQQTAEAKANDISKSITKDFTNTIPNQATSSIGKNYEDINKNFQSQPKKDTARQTDAKILDHESVTPPSIGTYKELNKGSYAKDDKTTIDSIVYTKESKTGNSQENKIRSSIVKSPDKEQAVIVTVTSGKLSSEAKSINKVSSLKSPENSVSYTDASVPTTLTSSSTKSSTNAEPPKEHTVNINKNTSTVKPTAALGISKGDTVNSSETSTGTDKPSIQYKEISMTALKNAGKETNTPIKPSSDQKPLSNVSTTTVTTSTGTKSSVVSSVSTSPQAKSSMKSIPSVNKTPSANNIIKTTASAPTVSLSKTSAKSFSSSIPPTIATAEGNSFKFKSNNVATVVSSISKSTASAASSKLPSLSTSSTSKLKSPSVCKQSTSPSTVKTISSIPTATVSTVPHDKISSKRASTALNKPISSISHNTKPSASSTVKEPLAASDEKSTVTTPTVNVVATTSAMPDTKSTTQSYIKPSENIKDSKGAKA